MARERKITENETRVGLISPCLKCSPGGPMKPRSWKLGKSPGRSTTIGVTHIPQLRPSAQGMSLTHSGQSARRRRQRNRQQKALTDVAIGKGFLIWILSPTSRKGTLFTCNPPGIQNDTAYGERYQIVIKRGAQNRLFVVPQRVQDFKNSFPLDTSYYMGLYFLCFHRYSIRKFVNILPAIFGR